ncbi:hypothetical protein [uncultured Caulobacter sp.]|uniref:hypothetical protein n=1 Tax=uncultured Caulobacter sp. TaxID=158749 RepID=UPI0026027C76|nr:hypothetical protein [uncultured Caulobacter sp.]
MAARLGRVGEGGSHLDAPAQVHAGGSAVECEFAAGPARGNCVSHTAYSQSYGRELDFKQLLALRKVIASVDDPALDLPGEERAWLRADLLCPSCRCDGAVAVLSDAPATQNGNTRQAHFRFLDASGRAAHKRGCDFYPLDEEPGLTRGVDVAFSANDRETRLVRELVCKARSIGVLSRTDIFAMRHWFLEVRDANTFVVKGEPIMADWLFAVFKLQMFTPLAFQPFHVNLPGFDANEAARRHLAFHYRDFSSTIPRVGFSAATRDRTRRLLAAHPGQPLIAIGVLREKFERTQAFARLMVEYGSLKLSKARVSGYLISDTPIALLAFASALLFVSDWSIDAALGRFAQVLAAPLPDDLTLGNVMGLNPFHDFSALEIARFISAIPSQPGRTYDFDAEMSGVLAMIQNAVSNA